MRNIDGMSGSGGIYPPSQDPTNISKIYTQFHDLFSQLVAPDVSTQRLLYIGTEIVKLNEQIKNIPDWNPNKQEMQEIVDQFADLTQVNLVLNGLMERFKPNVEISEDFADISDQIAQLQNRRMELLDQLEARLNLP